MSECDHDYVYNGVVHQDSEFSDWHGTRRREYSHWWYCRRCLCHKYQAIPGEYDSALPVRFNATPMMAREGR